MHGEHFNVISQSLVRHCTYIMAKTSDTSQAFHFRYKFKDSGVCRYKLGQIQQEPEVRSQVHVKVLYYGVRIAIQSRWTNKRIYMKNEHSQKSVTVHILFTRWLKLKGICITRSLRDLDPSLSAAGCILDPKGVTNPFIPLNFVLILCILLPKKVLHYYMCYLQLLYIEAAASERRSGQ